MKTQIVAPSKLDDIIQDIFEGSSLKLALKKHEVSRGQFYSAVEKNAELANRYTHALQARTDAIAEEVVEIADTDEDPQRARNRMQARQWYAAKLMPGKYGERIDLNVNTTVDIKGALEEARSRLLPTRDLGNVEDAQVIESKAITHTDTTGYKPVSNSPDDIFD